MIKTANIKQCPKCGNDFHCYSEDDCWCENLPIHRKEFLEIKKLYDDCLCPDCLSEYIEE